MHTQQLAIVLAAAIAATVIGYFVPRCWQGASCPALLLGFGLLTATILPNVAPEHFEFLYPTSLAGDLVAAFGFVLLGVLAARYRQTLSRRVLGDVLGVVMAYFVLAEPAFFALKGDWIHSLDGNVRQGVTLQSTSFTCMPSSVATVLRRWGLEHTEGEIAYAVRTTFQGTRSPRVPPAIAELAKGSRLQAKFVRTDFDELRRLDVPAVLFTRSGNVPHASALLGIRGEYVVAGEPTQGLIEMTREQYVETWKWQGRAMIVAPDFLHAFHPGDAGPRAVQLFDRLRDLGYSADGSGIARFQRDSGLEARGFIGWRTVLRLDALAGDPTRARLAAAPATFTGG